MREVRLYVVRTTMDTSAVPSASETAGALRITDDQAIEAYRQLAEGHVYVLEPRDPGRLRMANPFSAIPTPFEVETSGRHYYGNCVWDGLGIISLMGGTGQLKTRCPDCGETMTLAVSDRALVDKEGLVHFSIPAARWWDDIIFT